LLLAQYQAAREDDQLIRVARDEEQLIPSKSSIVSADGDLFVIVLSVFMLAIGIIYGLYVEYPAQTHQTDTDQIQYIFLLDVTIMMLVGFGYLMTFQRSHMLGAVGFTFLITTMSILWCVVTGRFFASLAGNVASYNELSEDNLWPKISVDTLALLNGQFAAAAVLISFGALIGKLTPSQIAMLVIIEIPLYSFNKEYVSIGSFSTLDMGGTIFIHLFGAYFGLAASWMLGKPRDSEDDKPNYLSDIFALVGTVFLWIYWPSFNGATALGQANQQILTTTNTVLSLCGSALSTYLVSIYINKRFNTVDVQNATLAGGVAIGAVSNLKVGCAGALLIGVIAGSVSTYGFNKIQSSLLASIDLHDSCGVHNLHGMPALLGSIAVIIATSVDSCRGGLVYPRADQSLAQLEGALSTWVIAVVGGLFYGFVAKSMPNHGASPKFADEPFWTVAEHPLEAKH